MNSPDLIRMLWEQSPLFIGLDAFTQGLEGWTIDPIEGANGIAVIFISKGPHFHFAKFDPLYQCKRDILKKYPGELIERYGYAETRTPIDDLRQQRFNERIGFKKTGQDDFDIHYRIETMRNTPCRLQQ